MSRQEFVEKLADKHEAQIKRTLEDLEIRIVSEIANRKGDSELLNTKISIALRNDIRRFIDETYRTTADGFVREYDNIVREFLKDFGTLSIPAKFIWASIGICSY